MKGFVGAQVIAYGQEESRRRMCKGELREWAGLSRIKRWGEVARRIGLWLAIASLLIAVGSFEPINLTAAKKSSATP